MGEFKASQYSSAGFCNVATVAFGCGLAANVMGRLTFKNFCKHCGVTP